jgi:uncharacterized membrane protein
MAVAGIVALWIAFAATHMGLSSLGLRPRLVAALGARGFQAFYSLVSFACFVPLVLLYAAHKHGGPALWYLGAQPGVRWVAYLGMGLALVLVVAGAIRPSPASLVPGPAEVKGVFRITRHPVFMGIGLFGAAHLLTAQVNAAELAFFGGFVVFAPLGCHHQDQRKLATLGEDYRRFVAETPFLPLTGRETLRGLAESRVAVAVGIAVTVLIRYFHQGIFGGAA